MLPYLLLGTTLWLATIAGQNDRSTRIVSILCLILMIVFTGLRYQLGYDWLAYEQYFMALNPNFSTENYRISQSVLPVEYLYFILNVIIKSIGSFELLLFIISLFNLLVIDNMANKIDSTSRPFVWFGYFCLALVMVQFNIIRQGIASSFIIISLLYGARRSYKGAAAFFLIAVGFHTSAILFFPVLVFQHSRLRFHYIAIIIGASALLLITDALLLGNVLKAISGYLPGGISEKTDLYVSGLEGESVWGVSPLAAVLIVVYLIMLVIFLRAKRDAYIGTAILLTVMVLVAHLAFGQVPLIWNRVMCVSLPWQLAVLWRSYIRELPPGLRDASILIGGVAGLCITAFQLTRPENVAFVPYHSLIQVWLFKDEGDGRVRSMYAVQLGQIEQARSAGR